MAWRDRTNLFISYRQSYTHHPSKKRPLGGSNGFSDALPLSDERRGLMSAGAYDDEGDVVIEMDLLPPRWLDIRDEVTTALGQIAADARKLEVLCQKHVLPGFDDEDVKKKEEREIERLTQLVTRRFQACQKAIKRVDGLAGEAKGEVEMARNLKVALATRVGEASANFRKKQSAYLKKLRSIGGLLSPAGGISTPIQNPFTDPSLVESETDRSFSQATLQQTAQQRLVHDNNAQIAQREREIEDIAQGIIEIANIFSELQTMVIDQGSMLDRIDYNVEKMAHEVKEADKELTVATGYQRRSLKRKIMLLLLIVIAGMFILIGLKFSRRGNEAAPAPAPVPEAPEMRVVVRNRKRTADAQMWTAATEPPFALKRDWRRRRRRWLESAQSIVR